MKLKTKDLTGLRLKYALAETEGYMLSKSPGDWSYWLEHPTRHSGGWLNDFASNQLIEELIDRYRVSTWVKHDGWWQACKYDINDEPVCLTLRDERHEAVAVCVVRLALGEEVEIPEDLE